MIFRLCAAMISLFAASGATAQSNYDTTFAENFISQGAWFRGMQPTKVTLEGCALKIVSQFQSVSATAPPRAIKLVRRFDLALFALRSPDFIPADVGGGLNIDMSSLVFDLKGPASSLGAQTGDALSAFAAEANGVRRDHGLPEHSAADIEAGASVLQDRLMGPELAELVLYAWRTSPQPRHKQEIGPITVGFPDIQSFIYDAAALPPPVTLIARANYDSRIFAEDRLTHLSVTIPAQIRLDPLLPGNARLLAAALHAHAAADCAAALE
jgi:hypothetical protein